MRNWKFILYLLGILPVGFIISILSFYFHARQILGRSPSYNQPDPKELYIYSQYSPFVDWSTEIWLWSLPIWLLISVMYLIVKQKKISFVPIILGLIGQVLGIAIFLSGIFEWYID